MFWMGTAHGPHHQLAGCVLTFNATCLAKTLFIYCLGPIQKEKYPLYSPSAEENYCFFFLKIDIG
jgi:hypothetical protein